MRIGIITFFQSQTNYGQLLQAFALQQALMRMGHFPYIIRYGFHERLPLSLGTELPECDLGKLLDSAPWEEAKAGSADDRHFDDFRRVHLNLSLNAYNHLDELQLFPPVADCYITGSDQVWAQLLSRADNQAFFLDFGPEEVLRLAYAPSFALKSYPRELNGILERNLKRLDAVSVREKTGVRICQEAGSDARWVVDPTMLLTGDYYRMLAKESRTALPDHYMFVYHVNVNKRHIPCWKAFNRYNTEHGIRAVAVHANGERKPDAEFLENAEYRYPSVQDWIRLIDGCEYMLTTSFHGMVFAILLHKPFFIVLRPESKFAGNDRIVSVLAALGLEDLIVTADTDVPQQIQKPVCWEDVDRRLEALRRESLQFLSEHLVPRTTYSDSELLRHWTQHCTERFRQYMITARQGEGQAGDSLNTLKRRIEYAYSLSPVRRDLKLIRYGFKFLFKDILKRK
jgi:hypothetical protein